MTHLIDAWWPYGSRSRLAHRKHGCVLSMRFRENSPFGGVLQNVTIGQLGLENVADKVQIVNDNDEALLLKFPLTSAREQRQ